jgi:hypothetical protein
LGWLTKMRMPSIVFAVVLALSTLLACDMPAGKVGQGQLYMSGEARYDAFFRDVHAIQVWVAEWPDDRKATRRPLLDTLELTSDAADVTIVQATHERIVPLKKDGGSTRLEVSVDEAHMSATGGAKVDETFFHAIEETASSELVRAKKLNSMTPKIDELVNVGRSLEPHVQETFQKQGPGKVAEVKQELGSAISVLHTTTGKARRSTRECDDFVADLARAVASDADGRRDRNEPDKAEKADRADKADKPQKPDKADKPQKADKADKPEKPEKADKPAKPEKADKPEKAEKGDRPKPEKPGKPAKPEIDKPKPKRPEPPPKPAPVAKRDDAPKTTQKPEPPAQPHPPPAKSGDGEVFNP